jgi:hypothetical protein
MEVLCLDPVYVHVVIDILLHFNKVPLRYLVCGLVWFGLVWIAGRWTDREVNRLTFSEGKKNAVAFGVVSCSFHRKS